MTKCLSISVNLLLIGTLRRDSSSARWRHSRKETVNHLLVTCPYARFTCLLSPIPIPPRGELAFPICKLLSVVLLLPEEKQIHNLYPWILWKLCKSKNTTIIEDKADKALEWRSPQKVEGITFEQFLLLCILFECNAQNVLQALLTT